MPQYRIYKYDLALVERQDLTLPAGARILSVQNQNEMLVLWALVDTEALPRQHKILTFLTGWTFRYPETLTYLGTAQFKNGSLVVHVFTNP